MGFNPDIHKRQSLRLKNYDYAQQGAYFVTICTKNRECLLGEIINGRMKLNDAGFMIRQIWDALHVNYHGVETDQCIIMPNHVHGIVLLNPGNNDRRRGLINQTPTTNHNPQSKTPVKTHWIMMKNPYQTLGKIMRHFKAKSSKQIRDKGLNYFQWQRNYYDRIIRNDKELLKIREYMMNNPLQWDADEENPVNLQGFD